MKKIKVFRQNNGVRCEKILSSFPVTAHVLQIKLNQLFSEFRGGYFVKYDITEKDKTHTKGYLTKDTNLFEYICFEALKKPMEL